MYIFSLGIDRKTPFAGSMFSEATYTGEKDYKKCDEKYQCKYLIKSAIKRNKSYFKQMSNSCK